MKSKTPFLLLALFIVILVAVRWVGVFDWLTFEYLKAQREYFQLFINEHYLLSIAIYIGFYILEAAFALPFAAPMTVLGGFLFGTLLGAIYTNIGATIGATLVFLLVRYSIGEYVQERYTAQLKQLNALIDHYGNLFMIMVRLIVIFPFFLVNVLAGLTPISVRTFVWTTAVGIFPASLVYSFAGRQLQELESMRDIFSPLMILAFAGIALLILVPLLIDLYIKRWKK